MPLPIQLLNEEGHVVPRTVYVTNWGYHDYSMLKPYGDLVAVTKHNVDFRHTNRLRARIREKLADMKATDLICISGPALVALEVAGVVMQKFGYINYLYWEPLYNRYLERATNETVTEEPGNEEVEDGE